MILLEVEDDKKFPLFTSHLSHELKYRGDVKFINTILQDENIEELFDNGFYRRTLYLVSMLDYLCRINNVPVKNEIEKYRNYKLEKLTFFDDVELYEKHTGRADLKKEILQESIPEFLEHNIAERNVRRAVWNYLNNKAKYVIMQT